MSERLPGLTNKTEADLREIYSQELGAAVPDDLTTVAGLRDAIKAHRETTSEGTRPDDAVAGTQEPGSNLPAAADTVVAVRADGAERVFTKTSWDLLGSDKSGWEAKVAKPKDLQ